MNEYLSTFFKTLESLKPRKSYDVAHGIAYDDESLWVLLSIRDCRVRIPIKEFDPDPVKAAEVTVNRWKSMILDEVEKAIVE